MDDFEPWRCFVRSLLLEEADLEMIDEASHGLQAVQRSDELKPDLILLIIGLPNLNGIAAAQEIHEICPNSKIIFLAQESSADVWREDLRIGTGFGVKADASEELLPAIEAVILDKYYLSSRLAEYQSSESGPTNASTGLN